ncbi:MAG: HEAT repeat domain-containing protein [Candidatus Pristimantibacillus lignocellulolyticus]|uniref:HEAT repeat domain-containing protein n=1 Tax=Candidatus Pristimantibacillus lignocellulolyticus TaxID=2994561 RepID=A0A9J6ZKS1_9BACL|nr:MAG: HEAT repeat domain-containing protein [Candidatus Pristimantibacillus lignocellulolyticus]
MNNKNYEAVSELPENFEELKKAVNRTANWKERLNAVNELAGWNSDETIKVLQHVMTGDQVSQVREAAFRTLKKMGEEVQMPAKNKGELFKNLRKILLRIKKSLPDGHTFEEFKEKLQKTRVDIYDTYEGDKGDGFDAWLKDMWETTTSKRK